MNYWQLASGDKHRNFSDVMLSFGIACLGPGSKGSIPYLKDHYTPTEYKKIKPILDIQVGDRIILKKGQRTITAVGEVQSTYKYSDCFDDIDGWDLHHYVEVKWKILPIAPYSKNELTRSTLQGVNNQKVISDIISEWPKVEYLKNKYQVQSSKNTRLKYLQLEDFLVGKGYRIQDAQNITTTIEQIVKLSRWYNYSKHLPSETDIKTFLVCPLLESLGWSPQKIALEYDRKDIIIYKTPERQEPYILIETKRMYKGSDTAIKQVIDYASQKEYQKAKFLMVTDGLRFWILEWVNQKWIKTAYMNFSNLRTKYSAYPDIGGALDVIDKIRAF